MRSDGVHVPGAPALAPAVSNVVIAAGSPTAKVTDCVDVTSWQAVFTATGASAVAPDQYQHVVAVATAIVYDGHWVLNSYQVQRDRTC